MKTELWLVLLALLSLLMATPGSAAPDPILERLRRIGRGQWTAPPAAAPSRVPYAEKIRAAARRHRLEPAVLAALVRAESAFNPRAVSHAGARGLGQLMPSTALDMGVRDSFDPDQNLDGSAHYLSLQLRRFGDLRTALAAYHAGPRRAATGRWPRETHTYIARVLRFTSEYRRKNLP